MRPSRCILRRKNEGIDQAAARPNVGNLRLPAGRQSRREKHDSADRSRNKQYAGAIVRNGGYMTILFAVVLTTVAITVVGTSERQDREKHGSRY